MNLVLRLTAPAKHSPFWRQTVNQSVLYQTNGTRRGIIFYADGAQLQWQKKSPSFILPMDVRAKQRLSYLACLFTLSLRGGGFAPRHLSRWTAIY
jgi:hypothetical protein